MAYEYFDRLYKEADTRFWINNPTLKEAQLSLNNHVFACTTNPSYCQKLLKSEPEYFTSLVDEVNAEGYTNDGQGAMNIYRKAAKRIMDLFMPSYTASKGTRGFVTIQDDPRYDDNSDYIVKSAIASHELSPNFMAKIPVIDGSILAIRECVRHNIPICATEVFGMPQVSFINQAYNSASKEFGNRPPIAITHITGIFDEYLSKVRKIRNISIDDAVLEKAGLIIARKEYRYLRESGSEAFMLGGGVRNLKHFTGLVGGKAHITINWSTAQEIIDGSITPVPSIDEPTDPAVIEELQEKFIEFRMAFNEDGMSITEFAHFGPVLLFRNSFLSGWYSLLAYMAQRRSDNAVGM